MLAWHLGGTLFLFRWIFRDPKVDVRFLLAGAVMPDVIDLTVGTLVFADTFGTGELWTHGLLVPSLVVVLVLVATRRGRRRRAWMAFAVGMFFHLVLDAMWTDTRVFLWPFAGVDLASGGSGGYWMSALERAVSDPWRWVREAIGVAYLAWVWVAEGLADRERRARLLHTGRLDPA
jgi:hypothetical protein